MSFIEERATIQLVVLFLYSLSGLVNVLLIIKKL